LLDFFVAVATTDSFYFSMLCYDPLTVSICMLSFTIQYCIKVAKRRITQAMLHNSPGILVFWCQRSFWNSTGITPLEVTNRGG